MGRFFFLFPNVSLTSQGRPEKIDHAKKRIIYESLWDTILFRSLRFGGRRVGRFVRTYTLDDPWSTPFWGAHYSWNWWTEKRYSSFNIEKQNITRVNIFIDCTFFALTLKNNYQVLRFRLLLYSWTWQDAYIFHSWLGRYLSNPFPSKASFSKHKNWVFLSRRRGRL